MSARSSRLPSRHHSSGGKARRRARAIARNKGPDNRPRGLGMRLPRAPWALTDTPMIVETIPHPVTGRPLLRSRIVRPQDAA